MTRKQPPVASIVSRPTTLRRSSRPFLRFHPLSGFVAQLQRDTTAIQRDEFFFLLPSLSSLSLSLYSPSRYLYSFHPGLYRSVAMIMPSLHRHSCLARVRIRSGPNSRPDDSSPQRESLAGPNEMPAVPCTR